jgi:Xaa-Pro aminopeptidase
MTVDNAELREKESRLHEMMARQGLDALLLTDPANVAWLSGGGRTFINIASEGGVGSLLITPGGRYLLTDVIEGERLRIEEGFGEAGWQVIAEPWSEPKTQLAALTEGMRLGIDKCIDGPDGEGRNVSGEVARLRWRLTPAEVQRYRALGADMGAAIGEAAQRVRPGMTEHAIAGLLSQAACDRGAVPIVVLVATDERIRTRRHPLPTGNAFEKTAMLVMCARRHGLITSTTRLVNFGPVSEALRRGMRAVATIEATAVLATRPGARANEVFAEIQQAYARTGYPDQWQYHHQGGSIGYATRDYIATPYTDFEVEQVQAFSWNPSVPGAKSEDTFIITEAGPELLTATPGWPQQQVEVSGATFERPDVLVV